MCPRPRSIERAAVKLLEIIHPYKQVNAFPRKPEQPLSDHRYHRGVTHKNPHQQLSQPNHGILIKAAAWYFSLPVGDWKKYRPQIQELPTLRIGIQQFD